MLILSRKQGEAVVIAGRIRVNVERVSPSRVRLGIEAPEEVSVDREEVWLSRQDYTRPVAALSAD